jgi:hypothetical protein
MSPRGQVDERPAWTLSQSLLLWKTNELRFFVLTLERLYAAAIAVSKFAVTQPVTFVIEGLQDLHFGAFSGCRCSGAGCHERSVRMTEFGGKAGGG